MIKSLFGLVAVAFFCVGCMSQSQVDLACASAVSTTDLAVAIKPDANQAQDANKLAHSACDTPQARAQLVANDQNPVQPDGGSVNWLAGLATAAKIAATIAPLL